MNSLALAAIKAQLTLSSVVTHMHKRTSTNYCDVENHLLRREVTEIVILKAN